MGGKNISEVCEMAIVDSAKFLAHIELSERDRMIGGMPGFGGDGGVATSAMINISPSELVVGSGTTNIFSVGSSYQSAGQYRNPDSGVVTGARLDVTLYNRA